MKHLIPNSETEHLQPEPWFLVPFTLRVQGKPDGAESFVRSSLAHACPRPERPDTLNPEPNSFEGLRRRIHGVSDACMKPCYCEDVAMSYSSKLSHISHVVPLLFRRCLGPATVCFARLRADGWSRNVAHPETCLKLKFPQ